ncbi:FxLYD domain-containing protein [Lyngbya confervoides]|uniref:FxLYD domain-containing protein n=1 Tax=Lyngbya confervoides BDU141951 TaxID=1574623 RepID=A0ABD4T368_9CYAN|nr:FxLYD domain-containing protein [Lyngbya confervoides]MCM1983039.1 FxLYD domain-containing protein [Lyngbya confervoides BDU141951]
MARLSLGLGLALAAMTAAGDPVQAQYQGHAGDIVVVGDSPGDWSAYQNYWRQLLQLNPAPPPKDNGPAAPSESASPEAVEAQLLKNITVTGLKLEPILKLNGSSQVQGTVTNQNQKPVTISAVNYEIRDANGQLVQTGSAVPEPAMIGPGQSVTFRKDLLNLAAEPGYRIQLTQNSVTLSGGG